jgi:hypothetical protein
LIIDILLLIDTIILAISGFVLPHTDVIIFKPIHGITGVLFVILALAHMLGHLRMIGFMVKRSRG